MELCHSNQLKIGLKIIYNNEPCIVVSNEFIKPGKGQAFFRVRLKNLLNKKLIDKTCKYSDCFKIANVIEITATYMFTDKKVWTFMDKKSFEQIFVEKNIIKNVLPWLLEQHDYIISLWNDQPISIVYSSNFIELIVVNTIPNARSGAINTYSKLALLNTGVTIKVPIFIQIGQIIKVDTRTSEYISKIS
ncbi:elongation factor P [Buchnera aphidicola str. Bp (Baizongia pistaciae)]|uniref:Elongation factor P n=1 Tax=Buchnera aphidicola subsp. Baizongia pistaciae (strain Bp) TaxID=224915 RepID=EFP_BUCBP|nr:elongation factor P [Buchnera aphidicola]Q89B31.1 RecName: Full=Elongation factor P; Short=EF-P [Buchnera aphidicola str. Bp (Baizongia pistaciae)]AAO26766.1 elongation factor P [Buchnera aphidicola str. Bp (Baizongia pistaciae)]